MKARSGVATFALKQTFYAHAGACIDLTACRRLDCAGTTADGAVCMGTPANPGLALKRMCIVARI